MKQVLFKQGCVVVEDVPAPLVAPGTALIRTAYSCISTGTELSGIKASGQRLWKRALQNPQAVVNVLQLAATQGIGHASSVVQGAVSTWQATGYSAAGTIEEVGPETGDLHPGQRVACAGAQCAFHAEHLCVPRNLIVAAPDTVDLASASTVALGAIALQGVRRCAPTLGETIVVVGLGVLGQLVSQILRANGCRVIGADLNPARRQLAQSLGVELLVDPAGGAEPQQVARLTAGIGADGVIITAATPSDEVVSTAFGMCRKKGRVVLVGDVGLHLRRADIYEKELDFLVSTSYGPGRYDQRYESGGLDYPVGYVRWTESRNMQEYLRLLAEGKVRVEPLIGGQFPVDRATQAYEALQTGDPSTRPLVVLLQYPESSDLTLPSNRRISTPRARTPRPGAIRLAVIGAGSFAVGMHLPNLRRVPDLFSLQAVVNRTGHKATAIAKQFHASYATTDVDEVLSDPDVDAVLIATRHDLHASLALRSLQAGKHVLLEKPLALTSQELDQLSEFFAQRDGPAPIPILMTGFNRRFSPHATRIRELVSNRSDAMVLNYRLNAGYMPSDHWIHGPAGGGRNIGEACHVYDLLLSLTQAPAAQIAVQCLQPAHQHYLSHDNFVVTLSFADGSLATLMYTALGASQFPKEHLEVFVDGKVIRLVDYRTTEVFGAKAKGLSTRLVEKGHREELAAFARAIREGVECPIPWWQQVEATRISFVVEQSLQPGPLPTATT
ncbi:MAG: bi-domain-containing oxidoreductase [Planctomycetota bacterium]|nr:bi-domain-containing oxidoreductase [Planctomycetota bacterium]